MFGRFMRDNYGRLLMGVGGQLLQGGLRYGLNCLLGGGGGQQYY